MKTRAQGEQRRGIVGRRIGVREASADRTASPNLGVTDVSGRLGQHRTTPSYLRRPGDGFVRHQSSDLDAVASGFDTAEAGKPADVHERRGVADPQFHSRNQAVPTGERSRTFCC